MRSKIRTKIAGMLAACFILTGCTANAGSSPASSAEVTENSASASVGQETAATENSKVTAETSSTTESSETPEPQPVEPLVLETPAGAVLVGRIKKDADGWYFEPEQPLTVKLTCYVDFTPVYENLRRINMFEDAEDGTSKELYRDDTVTVTGMLQNYRDTDTLYLYPRMIERGKTAVTAYAVPDLEYPAEEPAAYDPSAPLPDGMQPITADGHYVYNPYILTVNTLERMGNDFAVFYKDFVDAFLSYRTSCACPDRDYAEMLSSVLFYEFPLFSADGEFDLQSGYDEQTQTLTWRYTSADKAAHDKLISDFTEAANDFLKDAKTADSEQLRAEAVYRAFCTSMTYDYEIMTSRERINAYYAYTLHRGICVTFACAMSQLLAQVGVKATVVAGDTASGDGHVWNLVTVGGENYFCDSTFELSVDSGKSFAYFGMTMQDRLKDGSGFSEENMVVGALNIKSASEVTLAERRLRMQ